MASKEISQLTSSAAQGTDVVPIARPPYGPGSNFGVTAASIAALGGPSGVTINNQSASYIAALSDNDNVVYMNMAVSGTFTIPTNVSVAFPIGAVLSIVQAGVGQITLVPQGGVTVNTPASLATRTQFSTIAVIQTAANVWLASGDLA